MVLPWQQLHHTKAARDTRAKLDSLAPLGLGPKENSERSKMWVVVNMMVPFWTPILIRRLIIRVPKNKEPPM